MEMRPCLWLTIFSQCYVKVILTMTLSHQLLHKIADQTISHNERARLRCQLAKQLEEAGNYEVAREAMGELWRGVGHRPVLEGLEQATAAEVILRAGVLTSWIGSCRQIEGTQEIAKNLISESITSFEALYDTEKIAEAQTELAVCYWREGAFNEARDLLKAVLDRLPDKAGELKAITLSRLAMVEGSAKRFNDALRIDTEAAPLFEKSTNDVLKGKFHNGFGFVLRNLGASEQREDYIDRALIEYEAASYYFEQARNTRYQACVENNLGFLFGTIKKFREAHEHLDRAQALFTQLKDKAHIAQVDDARAGVLLAEGRIAEAEKIARCAVNTLEMGGEQSLYAEALTTHGIILARLGRFQQSRLTLQTALVVAQNAGDSESAGQAALTIIEELGEHLTADDLGYVYQYALDLLSGSKQLATKDRLLSCGQRVMFLTGLIPAPPTWEGFSLKERMRRYEGLMIERALKDAGGVVSRAARLLGYEYHNTISNKINTWHRHLLSKRSPIIPRNQSLIFINEDEPETQPLSILHVEDYKTVADAVKEVLEDEGWTVETCKEGAAARRLLESDAHFDVLIFDNKLPDANGFELIGQTRLIPHRQQTPIIMLSACDVETEARRAGANAFLKKPNDMVRIPETIARLLARKPKHKGK
jgi:CheY-like chemotaxis protein/tetratricopeptide (TPR) repeat protein